MASGNWSDPAVWDTGDVPRTNDTITVNAGHSVTLDAASAVVAGVTVADGGALTFSADRSIMLESSGNVVVAGALNLRPASASSVHTLRFVGIDEGQFQGGGMGVVDGDVGLWVVGTGLLDAVGSPKTSWTRVAAPVAPGATSITLADVPAGWQVGDEISIAPTEHPSVGDRSWSGFDQRSITGISANTVTLDQATSQGHPMVNGSWAAEVMNLTRNVRIEGTPSGRTHVMMMAQRPQTIANIGIRYTGPRRSTNEGSEFVLGRYGLHFHHGGDATRGSLVDGVVVRDGGSHAFVPHESHGITLRDTIAYNHLEDAYWWDPGDLTNDTVWDRAIAAQLRAEPSYRGYRLTGFALGRGSGNAVRDSVAVGVQGNVDASGFSWPEWANAAPNVWDFTGNVSHNNKVDGIFDWQNTSGDTVIEGFVGYHNGGFGIDHGAYRNSHSHRDGVLFENRLGGILQRAVSHGNERFGYTKPTIVGGLVAVQLAHHSLPSSAATVYRDCNFSGQTNVKVEVAETGNPGQYDFVNCDLEPDDFAIGSTVDGMRIRVQRPDLTAFEIDATGTVTTIPPFAP